MSAFLDLLRDGRYCIPLVAALAIMAIGTSFGAFGISPWRQWSSGEIISGIAVCTGLASLLIAEHERTR